jgi:hypothetical protein
MYTALIEIQFQLMQVVNRVIFSLPQFSKIMKRERFRSKLESVSFFSVTTLLQMTVVSRSVLRIYSISMYAGSKAISIAL